MSTTNIGRIIILLFSLLFVEANAQETNYYVEVDSRNCEDIRYTFCHQKGCYDRASIDAHKLGDIQNWIHANYNFAVAIQYGHHLTGKPARATMEGALGGLSGALISRLKPVRNIPYVGKIAIAGLAVIGIYHGYEAGLEDTKPFELKVYEGIEPAIKFIDQEIERDCTVESTFRQEFSEDLISSLHFMFSGAKVVFQAIE